MLTVLHKLKRLVKNGLGLVDTACFNEKVIENYIVYCKGTDAALDSHIRNPKHDLTNGEA